MAVGAAAGARTAFTGFAPGNSRLSSARLFPIHFYGNCMARKKCAPAAAGFVKEMELPPATLVRSDNQLIGAVTLVADCNTIDLPDVTPVALNWKLPATMAGVPSVI